MIQINGVTKRFGNFTAVNDVTLEVQTGEFLTLLGPSGCGKTTLLRMLSGFEHPTEGTIFIDGEDVTDLAPYRRNVNQVFQSYALFPHMTVRDNIGFGLRMKKVAEAEARQRIADVVKLVALEGFEDRYPHQLSGGQRQRVALARAIVPRPTVLLLDEPLSALDAKLRVQMQFELKRLQKHLGITFVFVTHDQEEALTMSDRIAVFNKGKLEQLGTADEIYHHPKTAFVADFIGEANLLEAEMISRNGVNGRVRVEGGLELTISLSQWPAEMTCAIVTVRPEKVFISKHPIDAENVFEAHITEEVFQGAIDRLGIQCVNGTTQLTALVANESALQEAFHQGDRVWCGLHADDLVVVLPDD
ncbi:spermidine/putrescine transport system ATP-binding protein [Ereboglobus sp. PH5-5]|uniref:Spermidine/putrescine import ATP-binding protein PotA n=1 Tax=Ereboglobus luteus TaxID=1796921 RepID=A0A2U8DZW7_9BACT|nr:MULTISPECIES: ABC transporter ATP-binding protein [Ereboglobus]AWI08075.1 spermidine/putrescine ABC transporter ATP-binding protein [Ereboglobus luteus]MDF9826685.1 spermidine/putrescine transport system ATP-binding protein [Ereboglobus sp. PH5-10]MDF9833427.1 spermidine/putrescine transport system ATP-binding protein [Ereboglobus sp. PH5-5]